MFTVLMSNKRKKCFKLIESFLLISMGWCGSMDKAENVKIGTLKECTNMEIHS